MKTFEERYTEWVDGELNGAALIAFEEELARRAQAGEAQADKVGAASLRALLRDHLQAPELTNTEFFNHQLRERIERGRAAEAPRRAARAAAGGLSWWSVLRVGGLAGAAAAFVAVALYYGAMPKPGTPGGGAPLAAASHPAPAAAVAASAPAAAPSRAAGGPMEFAKLDVPEADLQVRAVDGSTSATALKYKVPNTDQNVQVLWMNGLEYQPDEPAAEASSSAAPAAPAGEAAR